MDYTLKRNAYRADGIFGDFVSEDGSVTLVDLEHAFQTPPKPDGSVQFTYYPKINAGKHLCTRRLSPHFGYDVFLLHDVIGATMVEIHIGNTNADSEACICLGLVVIENFPSGKMISHSKDAFDKFMASQTGIDSFYLTVED